MDFAALELQSEPCRHCFHTFVLLQCFQNYILNPLKYTATLAERLNLIVNCMNFYLTP